MPLRDLGNAPHHILPFLALSFSERRGEFLTSRRFSRFQNATW